jgi:indole-3-glycerol phosphate synthase
MNILEHIVRGKKEEVARRKREAGLSSFRSHECFARSPLSLSAQFGGKRPFGIIAEIKRASPSSGEFGGGLDPATLALEYEQGGAAGISVLTDAEFFHGSLEDLHTVRQAVAIPILRKDFIIDEYQLHEAKAYGADAVLLIASVLDRSQLADLAGAAGELGLDYLVELYDAPEMDKLDFDVMKFVGINNRDLRTFKVDLNRTVDMKRSMPPGITIISESGIQYRAEIAYLRERGIHGALVGESLVRSKSPGAMLRELLKSQVDAPAR